MGPGRLGWGYFSLGGPVVKLIATAAKLLQSCPTLCDPIDGSPPGSPVPGILQAKTLEWVAISFSNAWKWKVKVKSLNRVQLLATHGLQPTRLLHPWDPPGKSTGVGCHCLLRKLITWLNLTPLNSKPVPRKLNRQCPTGGGGSRETRTSYNRWPISDLFPILWSFSIRLVWTFGVPLNLYISFQIKYKLSH